MDRRILQQKVEEYKDELLPLDNYIINKIGIIKKNLHLKLGEYYINCIPLQLGLFQVQALSILSEEEVKLFSESAISKKTLNFTFIHHFHSKEIKLFGLIKQMDFNPLPNKKSQVLVNMIFEQMPMDYNEILVDILLQRENAREFYQSKNMPLLNWRHCQLVRLSDDVVLQVKEKKINGKLLQISPNLVGLVIPEESIEKDSPCTLSMERPPFSLFLHGKILSSEAVSEGLLYIKMGLDFNFSLIDLISTLYKDQTESSP